MLNHFSFVIPGQLAGLARPGSWRALDLDLRELAGEGITALVSLTESALDEETVRAAGLAYLHLPVLDFSPPSPDQVDRFVAFAKETIATGGAVAVHCTAGMGRTGTMLACYLAAIGETPEEAIESVRRIRPGSIETHEQEEAVRACAMRHGRKRKE